MRHPLNENGHAWQGESGGMIVGRVLVKVDVGSSEKDRAQQ